MQVIDLGAWTPYLEQELRAPYFAALLQRVGAARAAGTVYPPEERTFFALTATPPERVRAVILGQDPYHEPGQAMGLAFSVPQGERLPPSLRNIFTELHTDLGLPQPSGGDLTPWAERGVLLLNTVLTVGRGAANSHAAWGWQRFTDACRHGRPAAAGGLRSLGLAGAEKAAAAAERRPAPCPVRAASKPAVVLPRLLRQPPVLADQCLFAGEQRTAGRLAAALTYNMMCRKTDH